MGDTNNGDSSTETEVGNGISNTVINEASLAKMFMSQPDADTQEVEEVEEIVEEPETLEEPDDGNVTEESTEEATEELSEEVEAEETEEVEPEKGDVLSKQDKSLKKMRKSIDKATRKFKTAEETIESRDKEIQDLKDKLSSNSGEKTSSEKSFKDIAKDADSIDDLQAVYDKAEKAEEWIEDALDQLRDSGEESLIVGEQEYTRQEIRTFQKEVKQALKKEIPARAQMFEQRKQYDEQALKEFPFLGDPESDGFKHIESVMQNTKLSNAFAELPEQSYIYGLLAEGLLSINAKQSQLSTDGGKTEGVVKKPALAQKIAPKIPFVRGNVAGGRTTSTEKSNQVKREIMNRKSIGQRELTKLFM